MVREVNPPSRKSYDATSATRVKIGPIGPGLRRIGIFRTYALPLAQSCR
jgi:hypothetical protein